MGRSLLEKYHCLAVIYEAVAFWHLLCFTILHDISAEEFRAHLRIKLYLMVFFWLFEVFNSTHNPKYHTCRLHPHEDEDEGLLEILISDHSHCAKCVGTCFRCRVMGGERCDWTYNLINWLQMLTLFMSCVESLFSSASVNVFLPLVKIYLYLTLFPVVPFHIIFCGYEVQNLRSVPKRLDRHS